MRGAGAENHRESFYSLVNTAHSGGGEGGGGGAGSSITNRSGRVEPSPWLTCTYVHQAVPEPTFSVGGGDVSGVNLDLSQLPQLLTFARLSAAVPMASRSALIILPVVPGEDGWVWQTGQRSGPGGLSRGSD